MTMFSTTFEVVRAIAVAGQLVRVVFSSEPKHASTSGLDDGRNPANYQVNILVGSGAVLHCVGVKAELVTAPAFGLADPSEFALDVQTDRPMVVGLTYRVTASPVMKSRAGLMIGAPYSADFIGATRPTRTHQQRRKLGLVDLASDPFTGGIIVDSAGDWARHEGVPSTRKRIWRIALTSLGAFSWLKNFGLKYDIKKPATLSILSGLRTDMKQQVAQQPDVKESSTGVLMDARGILTLTIKAKTADGQQISEGISATEDGSIVVS